MNKQALTPGRTAVMALFTLSCFGLLLFLWIAFGGATPLKPQGYRVTVSFGEATQLAKEADVRISGVPVGKVKTIETDAATGRSDALIELDRKVAPLPADARATLRQKTLLGETYVELTPGTSRARKLPEGGRLRTAQVSPTVELDEILRALGPKERRALQSYIQTSAQAVEGRGRDLNEALGQLAPFAQDTSELLRTLRTQQSSVRRLVRDTGTVMDALGERDGQLASLITASDRVFATTGSRDRQLREAVTALAPFQRRAQATVQRISRSAAKADPLVLQLTPAARELSPTLVDLAATAPDLKGLLTDLDPLITASRTGLPALERFTEDLRPFLGELDGPLRNLTPMVSLLGAYQREVAAFFANTVAATQASALPPGSTTPVHYLRTTNPLNPEVLAVAANRLPTNRTNPYPAPGAFDALASGLPSFETRHCGAGNRTVPLLGELAQALPLAKDILQFVYGGTTSAVAPPCKGQAEGYTKVTALPQAGAAARGK